MDGKKISRNKERGPSGGGGGNVAQVDVISGLKRTPGDESRYRSNRSR
jgi:hypothetical protein